MCPDIHHSDSNGEERGQGHNLREEVLMEKGKSERDLLLSYSQQDS